jgi:hypothetical protein
LFLHRSSSRAFSKGGREDAVPYFFWIVAALVSWNSVSPQQGVENQTKTKPKKSKKTFQNYCALRFLTVIYAEEEVLFSCPEKSRKKSVCSSVLECRKKSVGGVKRGLRRIPEKWLKHRFSSK